NPDLAAVTQAVAILVARERSCSRRRLNRHVVDLAEDEERLSLAPMTRQFIHGSRERFQKPSRRDGDGLGTGDWGLGTGGGQAARRNQQTRSGGSDRPGRSDGYGRSDRGRVGRVGLVGQVWAKVLPNVRHPTYPTCPTRPTRPTCPKWSAKALVCEKIESLVVSGSSRTRQGPPKRWTLPRFFHRLFRPAPRASPYGNTPVVFRFGTAPTAMRAVSFIAWLSLTDT